LVTSTARRPAAPALNASGARLISIRARDASGASGGPSAAISAASSRLFQERRSAYKRGERWTSFRSQSWRARIA
jgi:hypothetical protein